MRGSSLRQSHGALICRLVRRRTKFAPDVDCHDSLRDLLAPLTTNKEDDYGRKFVHRGERRNSAITAESAAGGGVAKKAFHAKS